MTVAARRPVFPAPADALGETLSALQTTGVFYTRSEFAEPWGLDLPPMPDCVMFHAVTAGTCRLRVKGAAERTLVAGDLVVVPHGEGHCLCGEDDAVMTPLVETDREQVNSRYEILRLGGTGETCRMICGAVQFDQPAVAHLVRLLPAQMTIDAADDRVRGVLDLMRSEVESNRPGSEVTVARLADVLVIQAIRVWCDGHADARAGWLAALRDADIGKALLMIQRQPAEPWSVQQLADAVLMSRSAFAERFAQVVGETPIAYVRRWKMHLASTWLSEEGATVAEASRRLGYESEASFSRAFKQVTGRRPGGFIS
jgi:AraC-like DNA-binding protein